MGLAVGAHTHQAALDCSSFFIFAHVTWYDRGGKLLFGESHGLTHFRFEGSFAELLHSLCQHGVPGQGGLGAEGLTALGAAVDPFGVIFSPVVLNAGHAVAVTARDGDRIIWQIQTHGAVKLLLCPQLCTHNAVNEKKKESRWLASQTFKHAKNGRTSSRDSEGSVKPGFTGGKCLSLSGELGGTRATRQV